jgi:WD40 repeat protein
MVWFETILNRIRNKRIPTKKFEGSFPVAFSPDGELKWALTERGTLLETNVKKRTFSPILKEICPHCQYLEVKFPIIEMVGEFRDWVHHDLNGEILIPHCGMEELDKAEIAACKRTEGKLILVATYPDQRPTKLIEYQFYRAKELLNLKFRYKPNCPLAVSNRGGLIAMAYGEKGRAIVVYNLEQNGINYIFEGHELPVQALCFIENTELLVSGDQKGILRFWRIPNTGSCPLYHPGDDDSSLLHFINIFSNTWKDAMVETLVLGGQINAIVFSKKYNALIVLGNQYSGKTEILLGNKVPIIKSVLYIFNWIKRGYPRIVDVGAKEEYANDLSISPDQEELVTGYRYSYILNDNERRNIIKCWKIRDLVP